MVNTMRKVARLLLFPLRKLPDGKWKTYLRKKLYATLGSGYLHRNITLPTKELLVDPGDTAVLVGTAGTTSIEILLWSTRPDGKVVVIEPAQEHYERLEKIYGDCHRVNLIQSAAWHRSGTLPLKGAEGPSYTVYRIFDETWDGRKIDWDWEHETHDVEEKINAASLDALLSDLESIDYIEIAVNGTEPEVLHGARDIIKKFEPKLFIKNYGVAADPRPQRTHELVKILNEIDYQFVCRPVRPWLHKLRPQDQDGDIFAFK